MKLRHLRAFVAVADTRSFGRAARELNLVQAALSKQVAALESELGARLFVRKPRDVLLTRAGEELIGEARALLELSERAVARTRAAADRAAGTLRLGYSELLWQHESVLASVLAAAATRHPRLEVIPRRMSSAEQWRALRERRIQVGIGYGVSMEEPGLAREELARVSITGVLLPPGHPLESGGPLHFRDLAGLPLLLFPREADPPLHDWLLAELGERGLEPRVRPWMHSHAAHLAAVRAGLGWTVAADGPAEAPDGVVARRVDDPPMATSLSMWWSEDGADPPVRAFLETARAARAAP